MIEFIDLIDDKNIVYYDALEKYGLLETNLENQFSVIKNVKIPKKRLSSPIELYPSADAIRINISEPIVVKIGKYQTTAKSRSWIPLALISGDMISLSWKSLDLANLPTCDLLHFPPLITNGGKLGVQRYTFRYNDLIIIGAKCEGKLKNSKL